MTGIPPELELRPLRVEDEASFIAAVRAFKQSDPDWDFAFQFDPEEDFPAYVQRVENWIRGEDMPGHFVPNSFFVGVVEGEIVGRVSFRHELNEFLATVGGHVGYGVVAAHRGKGIASEMLRQTLPIAAEPLVVDPADVQLLSSRLRHVDQASAGVSAAQASAP